MPVGFPFGRDIANRGRERVDWVLVLGDALFISERERIAGLAISLRLPTIFAIREHVEAGGLISYGVDIAANHERAAYYVDKVLKGPSLAICQSSFQQSSR